MSKIICDVCGTTYPETATQCPICGSAKNTPDQTAAGTGSAEAASSSYAYVKGGRFSKKNVRKRNKRSTPPTTAQRRSNHNVQESNEPNNTGLIIVVILLMLAIIAVLVYIGVHFFTPADGGGSTGNTGNTNTVQTGAPTDNTTPQDIPCTDIQISNTVIEFATEGESWQLKAELTPADTTDGLTFTSADPTIATVAQDGTVTAVSGGSTTIIISCGDVSVNCVINCSFGQQGEEPDDPPVSGEFDFEFNTPYKDSTTGYGDTTLSEQGQTWRAYKTTLTIDPKDITWTTDDPAICTIENGMVTAVAPGTTKIHAQYNGVTYTCVVRCSFEPVSVEGKCIISHTDVTISIGESFTLKLKDSDGYSLQVTWTCSGDGDGVTIDGNTITGAKAGTYKVSTTYDGETYKCTVRVKE